jgi:hypothetical protein
MSATDETQPLLPTKSNCGTICVGPIPGQRYTEVNTDFDTAESEVFLDDFDPRGDHDNPLEWPAPFKWGIVFLLALTAFTV